MANKILSTVTILLPFGEYITVKESSVFIPAALVILDKPLLNIFMFLFTEGDVSPDRLGKLVRRVVEGEIEGSSDGVRISRRRIR